MKISLWISSKIRQGFVSAMPRGDGLSETNTTSGTVGGPGSPLLL